jgi:DNA-binding PadR family transcriptional regulator
MAARNRTKLAVLGFLTWKPMSGYEVKKAIEGSVANFWSESFGQIYPILQELAEDGLATRETRGGDGAREQIVYTITAVGRAALGAWLAEPPVAERPRIELLLKLFFGRHIDRATCIRHVEAARARFQADVAALEAIEPVIATTWKNIPDAPYWRFTLRYGLGLHRMQLAWAEETLAALRAMPDDEASVVSAEQTDKSQRRSS